MYYNHSKGKDDLMTTRVTSKGQVTIPKRIREALHLTQGTLVEVTLEGSRAFLQPATVLRAKSLQGSLKAYSRDGGKKGDEQLLQQVRKRVAKDAAQEGLAPRHERRPQVPARRRS
jgi:AbrB family looped-hinge helix DNA binding protein